MVWEITDIEDSYVLSDRFIWLSFAHVQDDEKLI